MFKRNNPKQPAQLHLALRRSARAGGQALVEYILIAVLVALAIAAVVTLMGPAIGNVFSNTLYNLLDSRLTPYATLRPDQLATYIAFADAYVPPPRPTISNTRLAAQATSFSNAQTAAVSGCNQPNPAQTCTPTITSTPSYTLTPTRTFTATQATPTDQQLSIGNVNQISPPDTEIRRWQYGFDNPAIAWSAQYFTDTNFSSPAGAPVIVTTPNIRLDDPSVPIPGLSAGGYSVRYTGVITFYGQLWQVRVSGTQQTSVTINGSAITSIAPSSGTVPITNVGTYTGTGAGTIIVSMRKTLAGSSRLDFTINRLSDFSQAAPASPDLASTCGWNISSTDYRSSFYSLHDNSAGTYPINSLCSIRSRGWFNLNGLANPRLIFWERWQLAASGDSMQVGVRKYDAVSVPGAPAQHTYSGEDWTWVTVHNAYSANYNWLRQVIDLTNFGGKNFLNQTVEIAFRVVSDTDTNVESGWYLDDIVVQNEQIPTASFPFTDQINSNTRTNWIPECYWQLGQDSGTNRDVWETRNDATAGNYTDNALCPLTYAGKFSIPNPTTAPENGYAPILQFDSRVRLAATTDRVYLEYALDTAPTTWLNLYTAIGRPTSYVKQGATPSAEQTWETIKLDLTALKGRTILLRFVLQSDSADNARGWQIDRVELKYNLVTVRNLPYYEPFVSLGDWDTDFSLGSIAGGDAYRSDFTTAGINQSGQTAMMDSPAQGNYALSASRLATGRLAFDLSPVAITNPWLTFWATWDSPSAVLYLDISTDGGLTYPTTIWTYNSATLGTTNEAWTRIEVDLNAYRGQAKVMFRFRMVAAASGAVGDGWSIDDLRIENVTTPSTIALASQPNKTYDLDIETYTDYPKWLYGGNWQITNTAGRTPSRKAWLDSPSASNPNYLVPQVSILEYQPIFNVSSATAPSLVFWTKYDLDLNVTYKVQLKGTSGTWTDRWSSASGTTTTTMIYAGTSTNLGWHRVIVPIDASFGTTVNFRFVLTTPSGSTAADGIAITDMQVVDRSVWPAYPASGVQYTSNFSSAADWIFEGDWTTTDGTDALPLYSPAETLPTTLVAVSSNYLDNLSNTTVASAQWVGYNWHTAAASVWSSNTTVNWVPLLTNPPVPLYKFFTTEATIDKTFDNNLTKPYPAVVAWNDATAPNNYEWYLMRWRRAFTTSTGSSRPYLMQVDVGGGVEVLVNGVSVTPISVLPFNSDSSISTTGTNAVRRFYFPVTISGTTNVEVRYHYSTAAFMGQGKISVKFLERGLAARSNAWDSSYGDKRRTSLILNGRINIPNGQTGFFLYDERWSLAQSDKVQAFYSTNYGTTWTAAPNTRHDDNNPNSAGKSTQNWVRSGFNVVNASGATQPVMLKFELESFLNTAVADGWMIDNFSYDTGSAATNVAPTNVTVTISTVANATINNAPPVVADTNLPLDYHSLAIGTGSNAPRRSTVVTNNIAGQTGTIQYAPFTDWTGTEQFQVTATDQGGLTFAGLAGVSATVNPAFSRAVDLGTFAGSTINGNAWQPETIATISGGTSECSTATPAGTPYEEMIRCYQRGVSPTVEIDATNGVVSFYVYVTSALTTVQNYDVFVEGASGYAGQRLAAVSFAANTKGNAQVLGPYTTTIRDGKLTVFAAASAGEAGIAGIEIYRGGQYNSWTSADISPTSGLTNAGSTSGSEPITIVGRGVGITGTADGFRYVYKAEAGNMEFVTRITTWTPNGNSGSDAAIMLRNSVDADSVFYAFGVTGSASPDNLGYQYRTTAGGGMTFNPTGGATLVAPIWLKVVKAGNSLTAFTSPDGTTWTQRGSAINVTFNSLFLYGFAVSSNNNSSNSTAVFASPSLLIKP